MNNALLIQFSTCLPHVYNSTPTKTLGSIDRRCLSPAMMHVPPAMWNTKSSSLSLSHSLYLSLSHYVSLLFSLSLIVQLFLSLSLSHTLLHTHLSSSHSARPSFLYRWCVFRGKPYTYTTPLPYPHRTAVGCRAAIVSVTKLCFSFVLRFVIGDPVGL